MVQDGPQTNFGCEYCWPDSADAAWEVRRQLTREAELIDESHFHVMILGCPRCLQQFVSVFTETVDWQDGDDPQQWTVLPITQSEAADLRSKGESAAETTLRTLGPDRRALRLDHPKGTEQRIFWGMGMSIGLHD